MRLAEANAVRVGTGQGSREHPGELGSMRRKERNKRDPDSGFQE